MTSTRLAITAGVAVTGAVTAIAVRLHADMGTYPDWLQGVGTIGAFGAGLLLLGRQLNEHQAAAEDRRRRHASAVSAWCLGRTSLDEVPFALHAAARPHTHEDVHVQFANRGDSPIYGLNVYIGAHWGTDATWYRHWVERIMPPRDECGELSRFHGSRQCCRATPRSGLSSPTPTATTGVATNTCDSRSSPSTRPPNHSPTQPHRPEADHRARARRAAATARREPETGSAPLSRDGAVSRSTARLS